VVGEATTVVTDVMIIVEGGVVGHVEGVVVLEDLEEEVVGGVVGTQEQALRLDISLRSGGPIATEISVGDGVLLLLLECVKEPNYRRQACDVKALVLRCSQTVSGAYERIRLIRTEPGWTSWHVNRLDTHEKEDSDMFYWPTRWFSEKSTVRIV
jgi:hypothetical protein